MNFLFSIFNFQLGRDTCRRGALNSRPTAAHPATWVDAGVERAACGWEPRQEAFRALWVSGCHPVLTFLPVGRRGFTFIELLVTLVLIGLVMPVAMHTVALCTSLSGQSRERVEAATLARSKLCELIVGELWQTGGQNGDFGEEWPGYSWTATHGAWSDPIVSQLDVTVLWTERGKERSVTLSTLVYPEEE